MKKRKMIVMLLAVVLVFSTLQIQVAADELTEISAESPAIGANVGDSVYLADYSYGGTALNEFTWTGVDGAALDGSVFEAESKGVYIFDGVKDDVSFKLFIVVKEESETEYVLYENNFDDESALDDLTVVEGSQSALSISDGKLSIKGASVRVLLPELYADFGNYRIDADVTLKNPSDPTRWMSIMYRVTPTSPYYPYYQMAVRSNATAANGVEFARRTVGNQWDVAYTAAYSEAINPDKIYTFTVCAYEGNISESINDELMIYGRELTDLKAGRVGFQANNCTMIIDNIKISLQTEAPEGPAMKPSLADVREFAGNIATTPSLVSFIESKEDYDSVLESSPATAIFYANDNGEITDAGGTKIATLDELYTKLDGKVIAAFIPSSEKSVDALAAYCKENTIEDVAIASTDTAIINYAYDQYMYFRGIVIFEEADYSEEGLLEIRDTVNKNSAKTAIIPFEGINKDVVLFLQKLLITVWVDEAEEETNTAFMTQILSGANGIVVSDRAGAEKCFTEYFEENTFTRQILIIGHRGMPSKAPENSLEGCIMAFEAGADVVENDVYLTKDGVVVVMHDGTIDRTTNGTGYVESMTYEQLQQYTLDAVGGIEGAKIPTLEEYFQEFGNSDKIIFIEIKTGNQNVIKPVVDLIKEYNMESQVNIITFDTNQINRFKELAPEISTGYLCSGLTISNEPLESVRKAIEYTQRYNSTFNHAGSGLSEKFVTQLAHRGITFWPWTYNTQSIFNEQFFWGINGFTTDNAYWISAVPKTVELSSELSDIKAGESITLDFSAFTYDDTEKVLGENADIVIIEGGENFTLEGNTLKANGEGTVSFYCRYRAFLGGKPLYVCSDIMTLTAGAGSEQGGSSADDLSEPSSPSLADNMTFIYIAVGVAVIAVCAVAAVIIRKKRS